LLGQVPAALFIKTRNRNDLGTRVLGETLQVQKSDAAADDSDLQFPRICQLHPTQQRTGTQARLPSSIMASRA
jgi:hypothetical protein